MKLIKGDRLPDAKVFIFDNDPKEVSIKEIIGEDNISNLDPETIYFLNSILNKLNLKKIRNSILSEALPVRV